MSEDLSRYDRIRLKEVPRKVPDPETGKEVTKKPGEVIDLSEYDDEVIEECGGIEKMRKTNRRQVKGGKAEIVGEEEPEEMYEREPEIKGEWVRFLTNRGFSRRSMEENKYTKEAQYEGRPVQLTVDFEKTPKGARYGYDRESGKSVPELREHPDLLFFKKLRDGELTLEESVSRAESEAEKFERIPEEEEKPEERPAEELEIPGGEIGQKAVQIMEAKDEEAILEDMRGGFERSPSVIDRYFYEFDVKGRTIRGLSWKGVMEIARIQGHINVETIDVWEDEKGRWQAKAWVRDKARDIRVPGFVVQDPESERIPNPEFAPRMAARKAVRNGIRALIPEEAILEAYEKWKERRGERRRPMGR